MEYSSSQGGKKTQYALSISNILCMELGMYLLLIKSMRGFRLISESARSQTRDSDSKDLALSTGGRIALKCSHYQHHCFSGFLVFSQSNIYLGD